MLGRRIARGFAANEKLLKARIKSVSSIEKITKAMKMVAAAKMRTDLARLNNGGNFGHQLAQNWFDGDETAKKALPEYGHDSKTLLVPITSDKGLCGGINSGIIREVKAIVKDNRSKYVIMPVGDKGVAACLRPFPDILYKAITNVLTPVNYTTAAAIAYHLEDAAKVNGCDRIELVYNHFKNVISSAITRSEVMPR